ncbi:MAG: enoyl-CoA hydratase [Chloroflexi bacterium]|mgnify:CR=1 FL=1|jgi:cyclohexa-1,5-dienecarbonyl-CoA hydratase|nr:enoyl-CoA hydratase [Chloroflexota bacterium]MBT7081418.1 enoyl-CoA hydratase [Chloroflexota bacterium]MBT7290466.1 enoyl-CoA hydratase [Chloroflexota bacterium]
MAVNVVKTGGVAKITIDRPPVNVLDIPTMKELNTALESVKDDPDVNVVVIDGKGKTFSAGVDVKDHTADKVDEMVRVFHQIFHNLAELPQPTVGVIRGAVLGGGCEVAVFCDMVIASENTKLGQPEIKVGVFPPIAAFMIPRLVGRKKALELLLTGDIVNAQEALRLGLVNQVVPDDQLEVAADAFVAKLSSLSGIVLKLTKKAVYRGVDSDFKDVLSKIEDVYLNEVMKTADAQEGLSAFLEKRAPVWKNK